MIELDARNVKIMFSATVTEGPRGDAATEILVGHLIAIDSGRAWVCPNKIVNFDDEWVFTLGADPFQALKLMGVALAMRIGNCFATPHINGVPSWVVFPKSVPTNLGDTFYKDVEQFVSSAEAKEHERLAEIYEDPEA